MSALHQDSNCFEWGILVNQIVNATGTPFKILEDFKSCTLDMVKAQAVCTFSNLNHAVTDPFPANMTQLALNPANDADHRTMFYRRTRSNMIAKRIKKSLTQASWNTLFSKRKHFS